MTFIANLSKLMERGILDIDGHRTPDIAPSQLIIT